MRARLLLSFLLVACAIALNIIIPLAFGYTIQKITTIGGSSKSLILFIIGGYGLLWTISALITQLRDVCIFSVLEHGVHRLSLSLFDHLHNLSLNFHLTAKTGAIIQALDRAQRAFPDMFWAIFLYVIPSCVEIILASITFGYLYGFGYGFVLFFVFVLYCGYMLYAVEWASGFQRGYNDAQSKTSAWIADSLTNFETIKYFSSQKYEHLSCEQLLLERETAATRRWTTTFIGVYGGGSVIIGISLLIFTLALGYKALYGKLTVGEFVAIHAYFLQFTSSLIDSFAYMVRKIREGLVDMEYVMRIFAIKPDIIEKPLALCMIKQAPHIEFCNVSFSYDNQRMILDDVSFDIPAGKTVALIGSTGSGKSTIGRLLFRFFDVTNGAILFDGKDIRDFSLDSLRCGIGIIPQDVTLFDTTLYENIRYGHLNVSPIDVEYAVHCALLKDFIDRLPQGYQTLVGSRGLALSGGEKQRVAIARVFLKRPSLYIFDEATSALDTYTQQMIQKNLCELSTGNTTLIIAHRLSTVVHADKIIVLQNGKIIEQGSHTELLGYNGYYASMWQQQQTLFLK
jgi:ATP-binding cassette subfamily B protein